MKAKDKKKDEIAREDKVLKEMIEEEEDEDEEKAEQEMIAAITKKRKHRARYMRFYRGVTGTCMQQYSSAITHLNPDQA